MKQRFQVLLLVVALLQVGFPMQNSQAISFGCGGVQKSVTTLNASFQAFKNQESSLIKSYRYQEAYRSYWKAQQSFKPMYDAVLKSPKCFTISFRKTLVNSYNSFYTQVGACDRYGYKICSGWIKAPSLPCDNTWTRQDYLDCMENQARPDPQDPY